MRRQLLGTLCCMLLCGCPPSGRQLYEARGDCNSLLKTSQCMCEPVGDVVGSHDASGVGYWFCRQVLSGMAVVCPLNRGHQCLVVLPPVPPNAERPAGDMIEGSR